MARQERCAQIVQDTARSYEKRTGMCFSWLMVDSAFQCFCSCKKCKGKKTVKEKTRQEIYVERGMADRQRIVLAGAGDEEVRRSSIHDITS